MHDATSKTVKRPKVVICGAGIGGLTAAHELAKHDFDVEVYERNPIVGGLARSRYYTDPKTNARYPVEYSWRIYGTHYKNLLRVLSEIPLAHSQKASVFNNLVQVWHYIFPRFDKPEVVVSRGKNVKKLLTDFAPGDRRKILNKVMHCLTMSPERMNSLDNQTWVDFCKDLSPEAQKFMVQLWGPVLGMDPTYMSFPVIARMVQVIMGGFLGATGSLYVLNKPTNDGWFDAWTDYLTKTGKVHIKTNHEINDFVLEGGKVKSVIVLDRTTGQTSEQRADYVVCSLSVEAIAAITERNPALRALPTMRNTIDLAKKARQVQLSVQIFLNQKIKYPIDGPLVLYLPDTPWALIIEPQELIWGKTYSTNDKVKTVLSVGICQTDRAGILIKKPFVECSEAEIKQEVWAQIERAYKLSAIKTEQGQPISAAVEELFYMWDSFTFDKATRRITVWEPKFSNNAGSLRYQPAPTTEVPNLFFATGYTKTDRFIYSMEAAAEAGTRVANAILAKSTVRGSAAGMTAGSPTHVFGFSSTTSLLKPLLWADKLLLRFGRGHLSTLTFGSNNVLVALYLVLLVALIAGLIWSVIVLVR